MYSVLAHAAIQPQHVDEFITLNPELVREYLRDEPGTLGFDVIQDEKMANHFFTHETYVDEAAFHAHMHGEIAQRYFPCLLPMISGPIDDSLFLGKGFNLTPVKS